VSPVPVTATPDSSAQAKIVFMVREVSTAASFLPFFGSNITSAACEILVFARPDPGCKPSLPNGGTGYAKNISASLEANHSHRWASASLCGRGSA
jgi:hypothetical protein